MTCGDVIKVALGWCFVIAVIAMGIGLWQTVIHFVIWAVLALVALF